MHLLLSQHAMLHSAAMAQTEAWSFADEVLIDLTDEELRAHPPAMSSIAWLLWHIARIEDVAVNVLLANRPQVLLEQNWLHRLGIARRDVGTSMQRTELAAFSQQIDLEVLKRYRLAVGRNTREIILTLQPEELRQKVDPHSIQRLFNEGTLVEAAYELAEVWARWKKSGLLTMPATRHTFTHLNEMRVIRQKLRK